MKFLLEAYVFVWATVIGFLFNISTFLICNVNTHKVNNIYLSIKHPDGKIYQNTLQCGVVNNNKYDLGTLVSDNRNELAYFYRKNYPNGSGEPSSIALTSTDKDGIVRVYKVILTNCIVNEIEVTAKSNLQIRSDDVVKCDSI